MSNIRATYEGREPQLHQVEYLAGDSRGRISREDGVVCLVCGKEAQNIEGSQEERGIVVRYQPAPGRESVVAICHQDFERSLEETHSFPLTLIALLQPELGSVIYFYDNHTDRRYLPQKVCVYLSGSEVEATEHWLKHEKAHRQAEEERFRQWEQQQRTACEEEEQARQAWLAGLRLMGLPATIFDFVLAAQRHGLLTDVGEGWLAWSIAPAYNVLLSADDQKEAYLQVTVERLWEMFKTFETDQPGLRAVNRQLVGRSVSFGYLRRYNDRAKCGPNGAEELFFISLRFAPVAAKLRSEVERTLVSAVTTAITQPRGKQRPPTSMR